MYTQLRAEIKSSLVKISDPFNTWRLSHTHHLLVHLACFVWRVRAVATMRSWSSSFVDWGNEHQLTGGWKAYFWGFLNRSKVQIFFEESVGKKSERRRKSVSGYSVELCSIHTLTLQIHLYSNDCEIQVDLTQEVEQLCVLVTRTRQSVETRLTRSAAFTGNWCVRKTSVREWIRANKQNESKLPHPDSSLHYTCWN